MPVFTFNYSAKQNTPLIKRIAAHFSGDKHEPPPETIPATNTTDKGDRVEIGEKEKGKETVKKKVKPIKDITVVVENSREYERRGSGAYRTTIIDTFDGSSGNFIRSRRRPEGPFDGYSSAW